MKARQYTAHDLAGACARHGLRRSMDAPRSLLGECSLGSSFKHECHYWSAFVTKLKLIAAVHNWMHFTIEDGGIQRSVSLSPIDYEHTLNTVTDAS